MKQASRHLVNSLSPGEDARHVGRKPGSVIGEFGDLDSEANRVLYIEAMLLDRVIPPHDRKRYGLEAAFMMLPSSTMNKVVATFAKLHEAHRQRATALLKRIERQYVAQRDPKTPHAHS